MNDSGFPRPAYAWYVVFVIFVANTFGFIDRIIVSLLTPALQADLGLSDTQAGLLQGMAFALFYTLFGLPLGWVADRSNRKWLLSIGITLWSLATALCGLAKGFGLLFVSRLGVGVGEATLNPCASSMISDYFPPRIRSRAFGVFAMGSAVGSGLTYIFGGVLLAWLTTRGGLSVPGLGDVKPWQGMFILVGLGGLIPAFFFMTTVREPKRREVINAGQSATWAQLRAFVAQNRTTILCHHGGLALANMVGLAFGNWVPTFFLRVHGWEPARFATNFGGINLATGIAACLLAGWLSSWLKDHGTPDSSWRVAMTGSVVMIFGGTTTALMPTPELALAAFVVSAFFANFVAVMGITCITEFVPNEMRGLSTAVYYMVVGLVSSGLGPLSVGLATDFIFEDKAAIGKSLVLVSLAAGIPSTILLLIGLRAFRQSLGRATWLTRI